jgi:hypothetical protein
MATKYELLGAGVQRPDKRHGANADKPDAYIALRISVGERGKYQEIVVTPRRALELITQLSDAVRYTVTTEASS